MPVEAPPVEAPTIPRVEPRVVPHPDVLTPERLCPDQRQKIIRRVWEE